MTFAWWILILLGLGLHLVAGDSNVTEEACTFRVAEVPKPKEGLVLGDPRFCVINAVIRARCETLLDL